MRMSTGIASDIGRVQPMRKHPMSHILVDSQTVLVHHFALPGIPKRLLPRGGMLTRAILIFSMLTPLLGSLAAKQKETPSRPPLASGLKTVSFAWADADGVHLGLAHWTNDWIKKNAKNFPVIRFSQIPVSGADNYLVVVSDSTSVLSGFQPVVRMNSTTSETNFSGSGDARDNSGFRWSFTFDGRATSTTTTMTQEDVPYTIESHTLFASVYGGPGDLLISRESETIGWQQGGNPSSAAIYNLGELARRIRLKTRLLNNVARDIVDFPTTETKVQEPMNKTEVAAAASTQPFNRSETASATVSDALGTISVISNPYGAEIYVDDSFVGKAPATVHLEPGRHSIRAFAKDYQNWSQWITVVSNSQVQLTAMMEKTN
jgi:PEGA domain